MPEPQSSASACPPPEVLARFSAGELADETFDTVASHLSWCDTCLARMAELHDRATRDFLEERVRECLVGSESHTTAAHPGAAADLTVSAVGPAGATVVGAADPWVGQMVGRYRILKRLGAGGMGVVYLAEDPVIGRTVALKMISTDGLDRPHRLERFRTEGQALARVQHPNVVQFFHFDEHAGHPYFTMEFVDGTSLADRLPADPLPPRAAVELVRTVAGAVHAVHQHGVIHRDLKPSNILIEANGTPKITDFGLAKLADATGPSDQTHTGVVLGTLHYMAPEQAEGRSHTIDARADVFSLGVVLFAALTGSPPHKGSSVRAPRRSVSEATTEVQRPEVPRVLARICEKCLEKSPERRYATAQALADDLTDWLAGRSPRSLPGAIRRVLQPTRRQALVAGVVGVVGVAAGVEVYRRQPEVILAGIQSDLRKGQSVALIGDKGRPRWFQWVTGARAGKLDTTHDGYFTIHAGDDGALVELVPDPQSDSYRLELQVRHDAADIREMSEVGVFVARQGHPVGDATAQFFLQFSANDILTPEQRRVFILPNGQTVPGPDGIANLRPRLYGEKGSAAAVDLATAGATTPPFDPVDGMPGVWRTLEVTVTPNGVACSWAGEPVALSADIVRREADQVIRISDVSPAVKNLAPAFVPRGGLGLFVSWGTAAFRSVSITPIL